MTIKFDFFHKTQNNAYEHSYFLTSKLQRTNTSVTAIVSFVFAFYNVGLT